MNSTSSHIPNTPNTLYHLELTLAWDDTNINIEYCKEHNMSYQVQTQSHTEPKFIAVKYTQSDPVVKVKRVSDNMRDAGITVTQTRIKAPLNDICMKNILYIEFDMNVITKSVKDYDTLSVICKSHNATIGYVDKVLTVTLRCDIDSDAGGLIPEDMSKSLIYTKKNIFVGALKLGGFSISGKIESSAIILC